MITAILLILDKAMQGRAVFPVNQYLSAFSLAMKFNRCIYIAVVMSANR